MRVFQLISVGLIVTFVIAVSLAAFTYHSPRELGVIDAFLRAGLVSGILLILFAVNFVAARLWMKSHDDTH